MLCQSSSRRCHLIARHRVGSPSGTFNFKSCPTVKQPSATHRKPSKSQRKIVSRTSSGERTYQSNQQYSVIALTDTTGTISERYAYDAYGKLAVLAGGGTVLSGSAYGNRYTFTGREWDEDLGLYHYRSRMYSPDSGRFVSRDPIGYVGGMSLYGGYFASSGVDPLGLIWGPIILASPWHPAGPAGGSYGAPHIPRPIPESYQVHPAPCTASNFTAWFQNEQTELGSWSQNIDSCPCSLRCWQAVFHRCGSYTNTPTKICSAPPPGFSYNNTFPAINYLGNYHPGGRYELRDQGGTQCIYDSEGELLIVFPSAGTGDRAPPFGTSVAEHVRIDVAPYDCARQLDALQNTKRFTDIYFLVRPQRLPCKGGDRVRPLVDLRPRR